MKKIHISYTLLSVLCAILSACSSAWLTNDPTGDTLTKDQYLSQQNNVRGTVLGIYSIMCSASSQEFFGQRSIDMYGDLLSGDMTMTSISHNWFAYANQGYAYIYRSSIWSFYYRIIRQCNKGINLIEQQGCRTAAEMAAGSAEDKENGYYYAILLATRGWAYAGLQRFFSMQHCTDPDTELSVPIYTQDATSTDSIYGAPRATISQVYQRIEEDLRRSLSYYDACYQRENKLMMNRTVARTTLANAYLNQGRNDSALYYARQAIDYAKKDGFAILSSSQLFNTGFNDVENNNWIWGENVTTENKGSLASFWGHVDIFTYSYARMGDVMGIDSLLYEDIVAKKWDGRYYWWNYFYNANPKTYAAFRYAPDRKFFSHKNSTSLATSALDREYLNDNLFMRVEVPYLIAAEAAAREGDIATARDYLFSITNQRVLGGKTTEYNDWKSSLNTQEALLDAILYNWRVELWGEGYGMQTFVRYNQPRQLAPGQQLRNEGHENPFYIVPGAPAKKCWTFQIPTSEYNHNPYMSNLNDIMVGPQYSLD